MTSTTTPIDDLIKPINETDDNLMQWETLPRIIKPLIFQTSSYWLRKGLSSGFAVLHFDNGEEQRSILRPIIRELQRLRMPSDALLDTLRNYLIVKDPTIMKTNPLIEKKYQIYLKSGTPFLYLIVSDFSYSPDNSVDIGVYISSRLLVELASVAIKVEIEVGLSNRFIDDGFIDALYNDHGEIDRRIAEINKVGRGKVCHHCNRPSARYRCINCASYYCDEKCQLDNWSEHRHRCNTDRRLRLLDMNGFSLMDSARTPDSLDRI